MTKPEIPTAFILAGAICNGVDDLSPEFSILRGSDLYPQGWLIIIYTRFTGSAANTRLVRVPDDAHPTDADMVDTVEEAIADIRAIADSHYLSVAKSHI